MKAGFVLIVCSFAGTLAWSSTGLCQGASELTVNVSECLELESTAERHACYDRQVEAAMADEPEEATGARDGAGSRGQKPAARAEPSAPAQPAAASRSAEAENQQLMGTIAALNERLPNKYLITLENGQRWYQTEAQRYPLRVGQHVSIYPSRWAGSYRLTADEANGFIRVEKVR